MYKSAFALILVAYFLGGTLLLPGSDFSGLPNLPKMYADCKQSEDPDMDIPDFIFEHLLQFDQVLDLQENDPTEKPHQPVKLSHQLMQINFVKEQIKAKVKLPVPAEQKSPVLSIEACSSSYRPYVFRPPVA